MHSRSCSRHAAPSHQQQQQQQHLPLQSPNSLAAAVTAPAASDRAGGAAHVRSSCHQVVPRAVFARMQQLPVTLHQHQQQQQQQQLVMRQQQRQRHCAHPQQLLQSHAAPLGQPREQQQHHHYQQQQQHRRAVQAAAAAAAADAFDSSSSSSSSAAGDGVPHHAHPPSGKVIPPRVQAAADQETYSLRDTQVLVETAMLSAVSGLAFLLSTLLKLDNSLGYFLPLPITIAACRSGVAAGWHTMMATAFLLLVLLGPLRAITYVLMHGILAASLGSMWVWKWPWAVSIPAGAVLRMAGQLGYLLLSSVTMNENLFQVMLANVHNLLDQLSAAIGSYGSPSTMAIVSMIFALLLVNGICYVFLIHVVYHVILGSMGFKLGLLPGFVRKYLYAGVPQQQQAQAQQAQGQQ